MSNRASFYSQSLSTGLRWMGPGASPLLALPTAPGGQNSSLKLVKRRSEACYGTAHFLARQAGKDPTKALEAKLINGAVVVRSGHLAKTKKSSWSKAGGCCGSLASLCGGLQDKPYVDAARTTALSSPQKLASRWPS